jgi:hypothetical protein
VTQHSLGSMRTARVLLAEVSVIVALTACASHSTNGPAGDAVDPGPFDSPHLNFDAPLGASGTHVDDPGAAGLPFVPVAPDIGMNHESYVNAPPKAPEAAAVGLVYDDPSWDRIIVFEYVDTRTQTDLLASDEDLVDQGCVAVPGEGSEAVSCRFDPFTQVDIGGGYVGLLGSSPKEQQPGLTTVEWIQPIELTESGRDLGQEFHLVIGVQGYASTFSRDEAVSFAKQMVASQG